jgi:hypothetical protein
MTTRNSSVPTRQDILCGRCKESFNHHGNRQFRQVLKQYLPIYQGIRTRQEISHLFAEITRFLIDDLGARFLRKHGLSWIELEFKESKKKVGHAMRDIEAHQQQRAKISKKFVVVQHLPCDIDIQDETKIEMDTIDNLCTITRNHFPQSLSLRSEHREKSNIEEGPSTLHECLMSHLIGLDALILSEDYPAPTINEVISRSIFDELEL